MIDKMENLQEDAVTHRPRVTFFASPEAAVARAQLNRSEEPENQGIPTEHFSKSSGFDIPLAEKPSSNNLKNKVAVIEDIVRSYSTSESPVKTTQTEVNSRWRKLKICASLCANLEKEMKAKPLKRSPETQKHLLDTSSDGTSKVHARSRSLSPRPPRQSMRNTINLNLLKQGPENEATVKPLKISSDIQKHLLGTRSDVLFKDHARSNSPRPPGQPGLRRAVKINVTKSKKDVKQQDQILNHNGNIDDKKRGKLEIHTVVQSVKTKDDEQCSAVDDRNNEIPDIEEVGSASEDGSDDLSESSETLSNKLLQFSRSARFGRRLSLPPSFPSSANPTGRLLPIPPSARSQVSNVSPPISPRPVWSNAGRTSSSRISRSDPTISPNQETNLSLRSNLEVNRTIVSELIQQRSSVISKINLMHDDANTPKKMEGTRDCGSPRGMVPMRSRLLDRRATLGSASSIQEFNERRNSSMAKPRKSASVDSLRRNTFPVTKEEDTKYFALCDFKRDNVSVRSGNTATTTSTAESGYSSGTGSNTNSESKMLPPMPFKGRRGSMPCIRDPKCIVAEGLERRRSRSDAEIVEDIEDEIQQRISKRKQQLVEKAGGVAHHTRLQDRALARSTGGRLKQALFEMNSKRTTAELLQIASERKSSSTIR